MSKILGPLIAGDSWSIKFSITDVDGNLVDLNGYALKLMFKNEETDPDGSAVLTSEKTINTSITETYFEITDTASDIPEKVYFAGVQYVQPVSGRVKTAKFRATVIKTVIDD